MSTLFSQARTRIPRFADAAVVRARLSVVPRAQADVPRAPFVVLVVLLLTGGVAGLLAFNTSMQQSAFTATALQHRADALAAQQQSLEMDLERLRDPQQLASRAKTLGMVPAPHAAFVELADGKVLGIPAAASPLDAMRINSLPAVKPRVLAPKPKIVKVPAPTKDAASKKAANKKANKKASKRAGASAASTDHTSATGRKKHPAGHQEAQR